MNSKLLVLLAASLGISSVTPAHAQSIFPSGLSSFFSANAATPSPTPIGIDTLANRRSTIVLPTYTADQKQRIADQALYFIQNYYVHQYLKKETFGVDAVAELTAIQQTATTLSDADLQSKLQSIFSRLRDLHTNYFYPKPFQCYASFLPFDLEEAQDASGADVLAIKGLVTNPGVLALAPDTSKLSYGDVLVSFNGKDPNVVLQDYYEVGAGANAYAQKRDAMTALTNRDHMNIFLPMNDSENMVFKKANGTTYSVNLQWLSSADNDCLNPPANAEQKIGAPTKLDKKTFLKAVAPHKKQLPQAAKKENIAGGLLDTAVPDIHYQVLSTAQGSFGFLRLDSFEVPKNESDLTAIQTISNLLQKQFASTHGLIIDLRSNGGGDLEYGEDMLQLFTPKKVETEWFTMLTSKANQSFLQSTHMDDDFLKLENAALLTGQALTDPAQLTPVADANGLGQSYTKPVIVLVDSSCFSTCDSFAAGMQDHGLATIISVDGSTGGGGANVITYSDFAGVIPGLIKGGALPQGTANPFLDLPSGQDMRVAWREASRVGLNTGKLLENVGVIADQTVKMTVQDLMTGDSVLFANLASQLATQYQSSTKSNVVLDTSAVVDFQDGSPFTLPLELSGTSSIVLTSGGNAFASATISAEGPNLVSTKLTIPAAQMTGLADLSTIELDGMLNLPTGATQIVWRKILSLRRTPAARVQGTLKMDFTRPGATVAPLKLYQSGPANGGWQIANNELRVGAGPNYPDMDHAVASLFVQMPKNQKLTLSYVSELHSETVTSGTDLFSVSVFSDGKETVISAPAGGNVSKAKTTASLAAFAGKSIEIRFTFDSDPELNFAGPTISSISLEPTSR